MTSKRMPSTIVAPSDMRLRARKYGPELHGRSKDAVTTPAARPVFTFDACSKRLVMFLEKEPGMCLLSPFTDSQILSAP